MKNIIEELKELGFELKISCNGRNIKVYKNEELVGLLNTNNNVVSFHGKDKYISVTGKELFDILRLV